MNGTEINQDCAVQQVRNKALFQWWDYPLFFLLSCLSFAFIGDFLFHWFSLKDWSEYPFIYSIISLMLIVVLVNNLGKWLILPLMKRPVPISSIPNFRVAVVTTFAGRSEPIEMVEKTLQSLVALKYAHDTWVLDEEDDEGLKKLCLELGVKHFSRKNLLRFQAESGLFKSRSKHGNYNSWLYSIGFDLYDVIAAFDPDHVANPEFLTKTLGYFRDPGIGYVQAAQVYYNQEASFIARGAAEETYSYYSSVQMAAYSMGFPIIVGCHNVHRVEALKQVGGLAPHDADDLMLTFLYRNSGWKGVYVPEILAKGLTPVDWKGYVGQQRRWARSILDLKLWHYPKLSRNFSLGQRVAGLLHGLNYLHKSMMIFIFLCILMFLLFTGNSPEFFSYPTFSRLVALWMVLQACEFYRQRFYLDWRIERGLHLRAGLLHLAKWPFMLLAVYEALRRREFSYQTTSKVKTAGDGYVLLWPNLLVFVLMAIAVIVNVFSGKSLDPVIYIAAGITAMLSLFLIFTEHYDFPDPYDVNLLNGRIGTPRLPAKN